MGRTVKLYLVDDSPNGLITAEIMNWTGKIILAPRIQWVALAERPELRRTGIYFLVGQDPDDPNQEMIYIGESDNIWKRLTQHNNDSAKEFWIKTIIVVSKDENLTKAHVRYLESKLIQITNQAKRAKVLNSTNPDFPNLPEPDIADMDYFLEQIKMMLPVLGYSFAVPLPIRQIEQNGEKDNNSSPILIFSYAGTTATAQEINGEFIVFEGSTARKSSTNSLADSYLHIREKLVDDGKLKDSNDPNYWIFAQNVPFQSLSTAANTIGGASLNGRQLWKIKATGQSFAQWQETQIRILERTTLIKENTE